MYISCDYYRVFYYVAKYGSVSQAAKLLLNNQPNLTRTIKNLESELGCPLFSRSNRGMKLTPEGERLFTHISAAFEHIEAGESEIIGSRNLEHGLVYIASSEIALHCLLPVLKTYRRLYPGVRIRVSNHSTPQAIDAIKNGTADFAVVTNPAANYASLTELPVKTLKEAAVCSTAAYPSLLGRKITLAKLMEYPLISFASDTKSFRFYSDFFAEHGLRYRPEIEAATAGQIISMVESDLGVGFVPEDFLDGSTGVSVIDLTEQLPDREVCIVKRRDQPLSIAARKLEDLILKSRGNAD